MREFNGVSEMHGGRLKDLETGVDKIYKRLEDLKYFITVEINTAVKRAIARIQRDEIDT